MHRAKEEINLNICKSRIDVCGNGTVNAMKKDPTKDPWYISHANRNISIHVFRVDFW